MAGIEGQRTSLQRYCTKYVQSFDECREYPWGLRQENMSSPSPCRVHSKNSQYQRWRRIELSWRFWSILFHIRYLRHLISGRFIYFRHIKWVVIKASSSLAFYSLGPVAFTHPSSPFALSHIFTSCSFSLIPFSLSLDAFASYDAATCFSSWMCSFHIMVLFFLEQLIFNFIIYITHCYLPQNIVLIASVSLILGYLLAFKFIGRIDVTEYLFAWKILCMQVLRLTSLLSQGSPFLVLEAVKDRGAIWILRHDQFKVLKNNIVSTGFSAWRASTFKIIHRRPDYF